MFPTELDIKHPFPKKIQKKTFFSYYIEEIRLRIGYYALSLLGTWMLCSFYTYESLYFFLIPYGRRFIFTESSELFFQTFFFHSLLAFFWNLPYGIYQSFAFFHPLFTKSQKLYLLVVSFFFFFLYMLLVFFFFCFGWFFFQFFVECRIETPLLSIEPEIRMLSISWTIFQCFFFPIPIFFFFFLWKWKGFGLSRWYGWSFFILAGAWVLPPDFFMQFFWSIFSIFFYEIGVWFSFFLKEKTMSNNYL